MFQFILPLSIHLPVLPKTSIFLWWGNPFEFFSSTFYSNNWVTNHPTISVGASICGNQKKSILLSSFLQRLLIFGATLVWFTLLQKFILCKFHNCPIIKHGPSFNCLPLMYQTWLWLEGADAVRLTHLRTSLHSAHKIDAITLWASFNHQPLVY